MNGSPLLRGILVLIAMLALLIPLRRLTSHPEAKPAPAVPAEAAESGVHLALTSTETPFTFAVSHLGKVIWQGESATESTGKDVVMNFPPEGIDLSVEVRWHGEKTAALKLEATPKDGTTITRTIWGSGHASDVLTFANP